MNLKLVNFDEKFLNHSILWLQDPEIKHLTETPDFNDKTQLQWFKGLSTKPDYLIKGITADGTAIGVVGIKNIDRICGKGEFFGYIGERSYWGKGIGKWMMQEIEKVASEEKLNKIMLNVLLENIRAINLYSNRGYKIYKFCENSYLMEKKLDDAL